MNHPKTAPPSSPLSPFLLHDGEAVLAWFPAGTRTDFGGLIPSSVLMLRGFGDKRLRHLKCPWKTAPFYGVSVALVGLEDAPHVVEFLGKVGYADLGKRLKKKLPTLVAPSSGEQNTAGESMAERQAQLLKKWGFGLLTLPVPLSSSKEGNTQWRRKTSCIEIITDDEGLVESLKTIKHHRTLRVDGEVVEVVPDDRSTVLAVAKMLPHPLDSQLFLSMVFDFDSRSLATAASFSELPPEVAAVAQKDAESLRYSRKIVPREYQTLGVLALRSLNYRAILADAPGVGKTGQVCLALASDWSTLLPALVVCPASVLLNWRNELERWAPWLSVKVVDEVQTLRKTKKPTIYLVTWDLLPKMEHEFRLLSLQTVVFDESQYAKHGEAKRSQAAAALAHSTQHRILLSGTPLENRLPDLWHQLFLIDPTTFPSKEAFTEFTRAHELEDLGRALRHWMVRRTKEQVLQELPPKVREYQWVELTQEGRRIYEKAEQETFEILRQEYATRVFDAAGLKFLDGVEGVRTLQEKRRLLRKSWDDVPKDAQPSDVSAETVLVRLGLLRRITGALKVASVLRYALKMNEPTIIFAEHRKVIEQLKKGLEKAGKRVGVIDGSTTKNARQVIVDSFQFGTLDIVIGSQAMHAGVTLHRASLVLFAERWWVPAREEQAEDRAHRLGQVGKLVRCVYFGGLNTVDERLHELVDEKRDVSEAVMGLDGIVGVERKEQDAPAVSTVVALKLIEQSGGLTFEEFVRYCWSKGWV